MPSFVEVRPPMSVSAPPPLDPDAARRLISGLHHNPHELLGVHPAGSAGASGLVIRAFHPEAVAMEMRPAEGERRPMRPVQGGLFECFVPRAELPYPYRLRIETRSGHAWEQEDPYRFLPTLGEHDLYLFNEGKHWRLWNALGAHPRAVDGVPGVSFKVWAPNAARVSVLGDFCGWDGRVYPMRSMGGSGVWELFIPRVHSGTLYKYEILTQGGELRVKTDPFANWMERPPGTASRVFRSQYAWGDDAWMAARAARDPLRSPMAIYELHLSSWKHGPHGPLSYRELAPQIVEHVKRFGFTHIEPMPLTEYPFDGSWGYQVSGYYAPTSRYGDPDDFRFFVDYCHRHDVGVILDWVPAHFPKDDFALARFDGTAVYEHDDPRRGEHPDWGTLIFNYGRNEVRNFLIASALYWMKEFHIDGLRVDAVASMIYLDYSRKEGEWLPNQYGGRENLEALAFLRELNAVVHAECPGGMVIAEESTAWGGVSRPVDTGGLGFTFKWNMGWMHDTLVYFSKEPVHRKYHHDQLTFAMIYEYSENFIMPLSHDEVVHGKGALLEKMPGDLWRKFANLRLLLGYQYTRPGKKLLFQGVELAPWYEWDAYAGLEWSLSEHPERAALQRWMQDLGRYYLAKSPLWRLDHEPAGYEWICSDDRENSVLSYLRRDGDDFVVVVLNLTPVPRNNYRIGVPHPGRYAQVLNSDESQYHGSGYSTRRDVTADSSGSHGRPFSVELDLPPLSVLVLEPRGD